MFTYNCTVYRGTEFSEKFAWTENDVAVDLTGWQAKAQLKSSALNMTYTLSSDNGEITLDNQGGITLTLTEDETATMLPGSYSWDLLLKNAHGTILPPLVSGTVTVLQGVTTW